MQVACSQTVCFWEIVDLPLSSSTLIFCTLMQLISNIDFDCVLLTNFISTKKMGSVDKDELREFQRQIFIVSDFCVQKRTRERINDYVSQLLNLLNMCTTRVSPSEVDYAINWGLNLYELSTYGKSSCL